MLHIKKDHVSAQREMIQALAVKMDKLFRQVYG